MAETESVGGLLERWRAGDASAAEQLYKSYAQRLTRLAEQHLSQKLAGRLDGSDVVQSVFRTFFRRSTSGEFQIDSSGQLWRLLVKITLLKVRARSRQQTAHMRNPVAEVPEGAAWLAEALAREPGPDDAAALLDQIEVLLRGLQPQFGQVLEMRLQGHSVAEIAAHLGLSRQAIYRMLDLLQHRLRREVSNEAAPGLTDQPIADAPLAKPTVGGGGIVPVD
jgi:RNA polymerase sigma factor (sigma-70 family)